MSLSISSFLNSSFGNSGLSAGFSGNLFSGVNFSDYASLHNGSYYKLLKAYYSQGSDSHSSNSSTSVKDTDSKKSYNYWNYYDEVKSKLKQGSGTVSRDSADTLSKIQQYSSALTGATKALLATDTTSLFNEKTSTDASGNTSKGYDKDSLYKAVSAYVTDYNALIKSAGDSKVGAISAAKSSIVSYTDSNAELLDSIGIKVNSEDNSLSIDESKFKSSDMETVKKLFQGSETYASKVSAAASAINSHAKYESTKAVTYNSVGNYSNNYTSTWNSYT